ncbi:hypothetical protein F4808DRAFT_39600 [Astrocystis sublimbata]|nr:hypothetical protein F4808DRAFT_39600 [Astrocystis sublimbata]
MSASHVSAKADNTPIVASDSFQFITIHAPDDAKDRATRRLARSHAVKQALRTKRAIQQEAKDNFRVTTSQDELGKLARKKRRAAAAVTPLVLLSLGMFDPFQSLAVDSSRLQTLLRDRTARQAAEPVFSVLEEHAFHNFSSVFRTTLADPALLNAVMLSFAFAVAGCNINRECLGYQGQAIAYVRERMDCRREATSEATIGAILLLAGVEACLGMTSQVQLHMGAVRLLLQICQKEGVQLTDGIKRAIFWQDLNCSVLTGSSRIADHTTFSEMQWTRKSFLINDYQLPLGFQRRSHLLTKEFIEVLEDLHALQCFRESPDSVLCDLSSMALINNHTASMQSRLMGLTDVSSIMTCCRLATYLCSQMLCCKTWCSLVIPPHVSSQLLRSLQQANKDAVWDDHDDLLVWLIYIGGAFASAGAVRSDYVAMLRSNSAVGSGGLHQSWPEVLAILKEFIWSDKAFKRPVKAFWEEASMLPNSAHTSKE